MGDDKQAELLGEKAILEAMMERRVKGDSRGQYKGRYLTSIKYLNKQDREGRYPFIQKLLSLKAIHSANRAEEHGVPCWHIAEGGNFDQVFNDYRRLAAELYGIVDEEKFNEEVVGHKKPELRVSNVDPILTPESYDAANGILYIDRVPVPIVKQEARQGSRQHESNEAKILRKLFKSVKTMRSGILFHQLRFLKANNSSSLHKLIKNNEAAINAKVRDKTGIEKLISCDQEKMFVSSRYLKN